MTLVDISSHSASQPQDPGGDKYHLVLRLQNPGEEPLNQDFSQAASSLPKTQSSSGQESSYMVTLGTKRMLSETDDSDCSDSSTDTESDSNSESGDEFDSEEEYSDEPLTIKVVEISQSTVHDLTVFSKARMLPWIALMIYTIPPANRLPPRRHRARARKRLRSMGYDRGGEYDMEHGTISKVNGYFHLACPFYRLDAKKYQPCLLNHHFGSIEDIREHIWRAHKQQPYCPICYEVYSDAKIRDDHCRARTCQRRDPRTIQGITHADKEIIKRRDKLYLPECKRWMRIWKTIFPKARCSESPFLNYGVEQKICMIRDFWADQGAALVEEYLATHQSTDQDQLQAKDSTPALERIVLNAILVDILKEES